MKLTIFASVAYLAFLVAHSVFLYVTYTYAQVGQEGHDDGIFRVVFSLLMPVLMAGFAALLVRFFNRELCRKVFNWVLLCFSVLIGLFSLFAAYLAWWSATQ